MFGYPLVAFGLVPVAVATPMRRRARPGSVRRAIIPGSSTPASDNALALVVPVAPSSPVPTFVSPFPLLAYTCLVFVVAYSLYRLQSWLASRRSGYVELQGVELLPTSTKEVYSDCRTDVPVGVPHRPGRMSRPQSQLLVSVDDDRSWPTALRTGRSQSVDLRSTTTLSPHRRPFTPDGRSKSTPNTPMPVQDGVLIDFSTSPRKSKHRSSTSESFSSGPSVFELQSWAADSKSSGWSHSILMPSSPLQAHVAYPISSSSSSNSNQSVDISLTKVLEPLAPIVLGATISDDMSSVIEPMLIHFSPPMKSLALPLEAESLSKQDIIAEEIRVALEDQISTEEEENDQFDIEVLPAELINDEEMTSPSTDLVPVIEDVNVPVSQLGCWDEDVEMGWDLDMTPEMEIIDHDASVGIPCQELPIELSPEDSASLSTINQELLVAHTTAHRDVDTQLILPDAASMDGHLLMSAASLSKSPCLVHETPELTPPTDADETIVVDTHLIIEKSSPPSLVDNEEVCPPIVIKGWDTLSWSPEWDNHRPLPILHDDDIALFTLDMPTAVDTQDHHDDDVVSTTSEDTCIDELDNLNELDDKPMTHDFDAQNSSAVPNISFNDDSASAQASCPDPDLLPLPVFPERAIESKDVDDAPSVDFEASNDAGGARPAWQLRADDAPPLGLSASAASPATSIVASPMKRQPSLPGEFPMPEPSDLSHSTAIEVKATTARHRIIPSPIDIALAMQLRPGLGIGADPAWMVRFLMSMFGWFAVLLSGSVNYNS